GFWPSIQPSSRIRLSNACHTGDERGAPVRMPTRAAVAGAWAVALAPAASSDPATMSVTTVRRLMRYLPNYCLDATACVSGLDASNVVVSGARSASALLRSSTPHWFLAFQLKRHQVRFTRSPDPPAGTTTVGP